MALLLKSKVSLACFLVTAFSLVTCNHTQEEKTLTKEPDSTCKKEVSVNPNGNSELSLLMRKMLHSSQNLKELILNDSLPQRFPEEFLKIHSAKPTDSETKKASFKGYADNYLNNLSALYNSPKSEVHNKYNAVVNSCISCHSEHCPGPLSAIRKLKLE